MHTLPQTGPITRAAQQFQNPLAGDSIKPPAQRNPLATLVQEPAVLGFADGGEVKETPEQLMARMAAKYGTSGAGQSAPVAVAQTPTSQPQPQPTPAPQKGIGGVVGLLKWRGKQIDEATGYANGGKIKGPGTATSDSIPAQVQPTGEPIRVSTDERILSKAQDSALEQLAVAQGFDSLDAMLEAMTGQPVGPTITAEGKKAATGMAPEQNPLSGDEITRRAMSERFQNAYPTNNDITRRSREPAVATPTATTIRPSNPLAQSTRNFSMPEGGPMPFTPRAKAAETPRATPKFQTDDVSMRAADPEGYAAVAATQPGAQERLFNNAQPLPAAPAGNPLATEATKISTPPAPLPPAAPMHGAPATPVADVTAPSQARAGHSFTERNTAMDPANPLTSINMAANNESLARTNAIRQSMIDGDGSGPKVTMLEDSAPKETQALMDKWGRESATKTAMDAAIANPRAAQAVASIHGAGVSGDASRNRDAVELATRSAADSTHRRGQDTRLQEVGMTTDVAMRGQDITAQTRADELAGNPLTNALTQAQVETERLSADKTRRQNDVLSQLDRETDPAKRETLIENALVAQGKAPQQGERLTLAQMRANREIHAARQKIAGLSPEEIRRKTAKQTNTGRENPDFDPALERAVSLAGRRKIGSDDEFDQRQVQAPTAQPAGDVSTRFTADPAMKNHRLGQQTDLGTEVFDAAGKLIGHYR